MVADKAEAYFIFHLSSFFFAFSRLQNLPDCVIVGKDTQIVYYSRRKRR